MYRELGDQPIYAEALKYLAKGWSFAIVPIANNEGDTGLYAIAQNPNDEPAMAKAAKTDSATSQVALSLAMITVAREEAINAGFRPIA